MPRYEKPNKAAWILGVFCDGCLRSYQAGQQ